MGRPGLRVALASTASVSWPQLGEEKWAGRSRSSFRAFRCFPAQGFRCAGGPGAAGGCPAWGLGPLTEGAAVYTVPLRDLRHPGTCSLNQGQKCSLDLPAPQGSGEAKVSWPRQPLVRPWSPSSLSHLGLELPPVSPCISATPESSSARFLPSPLHRSLCLAFISAARAQGAGFAPSEPSPRVTAVTGNR